MTLKDWLEVAAILLSPLIAVQVTLFLQRRQEKQKQRFEVFRTLMSTRAANLSLSHVEALNMIDVAFYGKDRKSKAVVEACKVYLEHHNRVSSREGWADKKRELLVDMLQKMAAALGYDFDKVSIERTSYFPQGFGDMEWETQQIRKLLLQLLKGERLFPVYTAPQVAATPEKELDRPPHQAALPDEQTQQLATPTVEGQEKAL